jgi:hypothetical protein
VAGFDGIELLRGWGLEKLDRCRAYCRFDDLDRLVIQLDRLHRERTPRLVLDTTAAQRLAQLVSRDREQPRPRRSGPGAPGDL